MAEINKILVIRTDRLGDVVLTLPMLPVLRRNFPEAHISMLVSAYTSELLRGNPYLDELLLYDDSSSLIPFHELLRALKTRGFDTAVVVHPTFRLALLVFLARIPNRVGTGYRWYSFLFNKKVFEHRKDAKRHEAEYNLNLLHAIGCDWDFPLEFPIEIPARSIQKAREICERYSVTEENPLLIIHPGSRGSSRDWSPANFGRLGARLTTELGATVILTGTKGEEEIVGKVLHHIPQGAINLVNKLGLMDLVALIQRADLLISNSTAPLHLAAAVGTPVIGFYPPIRHLGPQRWGPYTNKKRVFVPDKNLCPRCQGGECEASDCMDQITVGQVFQAVVELLKTSDTKRKQITDEQKLVS